MHLRGKIWGNAGLQTVTAPKKTRAHDNQAKPEVCIPVPVPKDAERRIIQNCPSGTMVKSTVQSTPWEKRATPRKRLRLRKDSKSLVLRSSTWSLLDHARGKRRPLRNRTHIRPVSPTSRCEVQGSRIDTSADAACSVSSSYPVSVVPADGDELLTPTFASCIDSFDSLVSRYNTPLPLDTTPDDPVSTDKDSAGLDPLLERNLFSDVWTLEGAHSDLVDVEGVSELDEVTFVSETSDDENVDVNSNGAPVYDTSPATDGQLEGNWDSVFQTSESILFFDWDDTLLPSTWLSSNRLTLEEDCHVPPEFRPLLDELAECARKTLERAALHGFVVIVTNAEHGWIDLSCLKFMPSLSPHIQKYKQMSARTMYESPECRSPFTWKQLAFRNEIVSLWEDKPKIRQKNIMSFGDSTHERMAILTITRRVHPEEDGSLQIDAGMTITDCEPCPELSRCVGAFRTKSVKFMERPDIEHLKKEHNLILGCLDDIIQQNCDLDLIIQPQSIGADNSGIPHVAQSLVNCRLPPLPALRPLTAANGNRPPPTSNKTTETAAPVLARNTATVAPTARKRPNKKLSERNHSSMWSAAIAQRSVAEPLTSPSTVPQEQLRREKFLPPCVHPLSGVPASSPLPKHTSLENDSATPTTPTESV